jgi:hypothetical protein
MNRLAWVARCEDCQRLGFRVAYVPRGNGYMPVCETCEGRTWLVVELSEDEERKLDEAGIKRTVGLSH